MADVRPFRKNKSIDSLYYQSWIHRFLIARYFNLCMQWNLHYELYYKYQVY